MAVIQYSALVTQLRGKLGGSQFNKGHAGYSLQRKSTPTIRQTPAQLAQRQRVAIAQRAWKDESEARRQAAQLAAESNPVSNRLGQQVILSAYSHYVKMMVMRQLVGIGQNITPISSNIRTTPAPSLTVDINISHISIQNFVSNDISTISMTGTRTVSPPTAPGGDSISIKYYITPTDEFGRKLTGARRMFLFHSGYNDNPYNLTDFPFYTSQYIHEESYVLFEAHIWNQNAGALVYVHQQLIQLQ